jgi:hypothetical protein
LQSPDWFLVTEEAVNCAFPKTIAEVLATGYTPINRFDDDF